MRVLPSILVALLVLSGLSMRAVANGICCPDPHSHASDSSPHNHDHSGGHHDCPPAHTHQEQAPSDGESCPQDCDDHHHHHGNCIHFQPISLSADHHIRLPFLHSVLLQRDGFHLRPPDGPVHELDKPPLI